MVTEIFTMTVTIPSPDKIDFKNGQTISNNWKRFVKQWRNFELATGLNEGLQQD